MQEPRLINEILARYKFPNLIAEVAESGYGLHTITNFMGYREYNEEEIRTKLISGGYYSVDVGYMLPEELTLENGKPKACWRWLKENEKKGTTSETVQRNKSNRAGTKRETVSNTFSKAMYRADRGRKNKGIRIYTEISITKEWYKWQS